MNDFYRIKSERYVTISNDFLKDKNLSNKTKGVLAMILALPDNWDFSIKGMVSITKDGEASLRTAINELKKEGYCIDKPVRINGKIARWKYYFSGEKITESLLCDFLKVENLNIENRAQYNNIINEENIKNKENDKNKFLSKKETKSTRFVKPTVEKIEAYIKEKGFHFDAEQFFDYYESKGWMVGSSHMKDWQAACRTWERKRKQDGISNEQSEEAADDERWKASYEWMQKNVPNIADKINKDIFRMFREESLCDKYTLAERLREMNAQYDGSDIVEFFKRKYLP